jgi:hypothetical protein
VVSAVRFCPSPSHRQAVSGVLRGGAVAPVNSWVNPGCRNWATTGGDSLSARPGRSICERRANSRKRPVGPGGNSAPPRTLARLIAVLDPPRSLVSLVSIQDLLREIEALGPITTLAPLVIDPELPVDRLFPGEQSGSLQPRKFPPCLVVGELRNPPTDGVAVSVTQGRTRLAWLRDRGGQRSRAPLTESKHAI